MNSTERTNNSIDNSATAMIIGMIPKPSQASLDILSGFKLLSIGRYFMI